MDGGLGRLYLTAKARTWECYSQVSIIISIIYRGAHNWCPCVVKNKQAAENMEGSSSEYTLRKKRYKSCHWGGSFSKGTLLYLKGAYWYLHGAYLYNYGTNMHPLGTKVSLLKRNRPSDSFCTFFLTVYQHFMVWDSHGIQGLNPQFNHHGVKVSHLNVFCLANLHIQTIFNAEEETKIGTYTVKKYCWFNLKK